MSIDIEVLIVSYESADVIGDCIHSITTMIPGASVAVREHGRDRSAVDRVAQIVARHDGPIRFEHDPSNPGFGAGCNALASASTARWLLFLNPDAVLVSWPWTSLRPPPGTTIVGATIEGDGHPGDHYGTSYRIRDEIARSWLRRTGRPPNGRGFVSGAALLLDAESFNRLGGFDPRYFMFYEDIELCRRANASGITTSIEPAWRVRHIGAHSTRARFREALEWSYESACRFHASGGSSLVAYRAYAAVDAIARLAVNGLLGRGRQARAYAHMVQRSLDDLIRRRRITA